MSTTIRDIYLQHRDYRMWMARAVCHPLIPPGRKEVLVRQARILNWCALDETRATAADYAELRRQGLIPEESNDESE
jgi:hypothetical protein